MQGCGNLVGCHQWQSAGSALTECYIADPTSGAGTHPDGFEIYSSDNLTIQRCRLMINSATDQSCLNMTNDFGALPVGNPVIVQDCYINGGISPILTRPQGAITKKNIRYTGNYLGDSSQYGRECDFNSMNVTYNLNYHLASPSVIYWSPTNLWAPNGEGVLDPATAPSTDVPAGKPHIPGNFVDARNFYAGEIFVWNGMVVGPAGP